MDGCAEFSFRRHCFRTERLSRQRGIFSRCGCRGHSLTLFAFTRGHSRIEPLVAWLIAIVTCGLIGTAALKLDPDAFMSTSARIACGTIWILWLGTQLDWASLRKIFLIARIPESVVASLDHAVMHGVFTRSEWIRRRDTARLRQGDPALSLSAWGRVVGEGALHSFFQARSGGRKRALAERVHGW